MRLIHLSSSSRDRGNAGGVEMFAWYLRKATGCELAVGSFPENLDPKSTLIICDFHWVCYVPERFTTICVIHGSMAELATRVKKLNDFAGVIQQQNQACHRPNTYFVACSPSALRYAREHHQVALNDAIVIRHGVDRNEFDRIHAPAAPPFVVLHTANSYVKNPDMVAAIRDELNRIDPELFQVEYLDARVGESAQRFARGHIFLHPSTYEGNSFSCLEAAMMGLPLVVSESGLFDGYERQEDEHFGMILPRTATAADYADEILEVARIYYMRVWEPRRWALRVADYDRFATEWRELIARVQAEKRLA